jgi:hypothetical protein
MYESTWPYAGECLHASEIRALTAEARDLQASGEVGFAVCASIIATGEGLMPDCEQLQRAGIFECQLRAELGRLANFVKEHEAERAAIAVRRGHALRKFPIEEKYRQLEETIDAAGEEAYLIRSRASYVSRRDLRQTPGACYEMSAILRQVLLHRPEPIRTQIMAYHSYDGNHYFLQTVGLEDVFDIDPTWQQFMPKSTNFNDIPHVLIMPQVNRRDALSAHRVPAPRQEIWQQSISSPDLESDLYDSQIRRIFRREGWL